MQLLRKITITVRITAVLALLVVLIGLGAYIYFVESKRPASSEAETTKEKVYTLEGDKIEQIKVKSEKGETTTLKKSDGTWQILEPIETKADQSEVSGITTNLASLELQRVVEEAPADLAQYGLAKPRVEVDFKATGDLMELKLKAIEAHCSQVEGMLKFFGENFFREAMDMEVYRLAETK